MRARGRDISARTAFCLKGKTETIINQDKYAVCAGWCEGAANSASTHEAAATWRRFWRNSSGYPRFAYTGYTPFSSGRASARRSCICCCLRICHGRKGITNASPVLNHAASTFAARAYDQAHATARDHAFTRASPRSSGQTQGKQIWVTCSHNARADGSRRQRSDVAGEAA
jgi:hypothetical protein